MLFVVVVVGCIFLVFTKRKYQKKLDSITAKFSENKKAVSEDAVIQKIPATVMHEKKMFLATENEKKLYFALQKVLSNKYIVHCQVPLISVVVPVESKNNRRSWAKRVDFVVTDKATKILAVIELDDSSHNSEKAQQRDLYVNEALKGNHPLIRLATERFYDPKVIAKKLYEEAEIESSYCYGKASV